MQPSSSKKTKGRQKIEIKKIESEDVCHVTFSKRRIGVFKKASDLSTLCGANIALVVHSPTGKPYSFGCPDVEEVINRYFIGTTMGDILGLTQEQGGHPALLKELNEKFMEESKRIDDGKAKKMMVEGAKKELGSEKFVLAMSSDMEELPLYELEGLEADLEKIKMRLDASARELLMNVNPFAGTYNQDLAMAPFAGGGANPFEGNMGFGFFGQGNY
ncbi:MADS box transcription factor domain-containing protein [Dioscorea alata]|uniref:MADS box transcription factor domain-containing protein n=1 Tax=Dioscorea alata TaxID=55571 RepID=A0ACB7UKG0_DIOAL|nr:MADS box transcription factor domain-containing protein [Dioscorea alata]